MNTKINIIPLNDKELDENKGGNPAILVAAIGLYLGYAYFTYDVGFEHGLHGIGPFAKDKIFRTNNYHVSSIGNLLV